MEFKIKRIGTDGEGIAYYQNKPVYIYYAYKDEVVQADLFVNKRGAFEANLVEVLKPSRHRVSVKWPYYMKSGSVNLMHISYREQLKFKRDVISFLLITNLKKETTNTKLNLTIPSDLHVHYRNKSDIPLITLVRETKMANYYRGSNLIFPVDSLVVEDLVIEQTTKTVIKLMSKYGLRAYDFKNRRGTILSIQTRVNLKGEAQITLVTKNKVDLTHFISELRASNPHIVGVYENYVKDYKTSADIYKGELSLLSGTKYLEMQINNLKFYLTPFAFFQLNTLQAAKLYNTILNLGNFNNNDIVLDAYCGVGTIAMHLSPHVSEVVAIESNKVAVKDMEYSLDVNEIKNVKAITGDFTKLATYLKEKFTKMIFNPPRTGLGPKVCKYILKVLPKQVIYVSCNPKTMVDDLKLLSDKYEINSITPFDMFPQTSQIESIIILNLKDR